jgi:hypothetical protein
MMSLRSRHKCAKRSHRGWWRDIGPVRVRWIAAVGSLLAACALAAPARAISFSQQTLPLDGERRLRESVTIRP